MSQVVCFGGGTNSTAMLVGLRERGERPDAIVFADTGGEKPHTYEHVEAMQEWCSANAFPRIAVVQSEDKEGNAYTLEENCLEGKRLPSIAYGFKACSEKHKIRPQNKWMKANGLTDAIRLIGFDGGERHRAKNYPGNRYPLLEWDWDREDCIAAIERAGLPQPGKSSCFFCPNSKKAEILELKKVYPVLFMRAVAMENNADLTTIKGLGRDFAWRDLAAWDEAQLGLFPESRVEIACECVD